MKKNTLKQILLFIGIQLVIFQSLRAQYPLDCGTIDSRANSNGLANKCPNVSGTPYASNFVGTPYANLPVTAKTGDITFRYSNATTSLKPFAITKVWVTSTGTTLSNVAFGPASQPTVSGNDIVVSYCFYGVNMPTAGTLSFELTNPETGLAVQICSFDAGCNSGCLAVSNPIALLPVKFTAFSVKEVNSGIQLDWTTAQESNAKGYQVQRSVDGTDFADLGFVTAVGNSTVKNNYSYTDYYAGQEATLFYRLRHLDLDGGSTYSKVVRLSRNALSSRFMVSSKQGEIALRMSPGATAISNYSVALYSAEGNLKAEKRVIAQGGVNFTNLTPGLYYVRVVSDKGERHTFSVSCR